MHTHLNIPLTHSQGILTWDKNTIDHLVQAAIRLVVKIGLCLPDDGDGIYLAEAEKKGARIERSTRTVKFTEEDVAETIAVLRRTSPVPAPLRPLATSQKGRKETFHVGNCGNFIFDWDSWQARAPSVRDLVRICWWAQGCDDIAGVYPVLLKDIINQRLEPIYSYALMGKYCRKEFYHAKPTEPIHVRYLEQMARVVERHRGFYQPMPEDEYINSPFRMAFRAISTMLERIDTGICKDICIGTIALSGLTAPITVAGAAVTALAEILAGLTFFHILRPECGLRANSSAGSFDLRTAQVSFFGMHTHLANLAVWDLLVRGIGADATFLIFYRDANEPGMQAVYEFGIAQAFFSSIYTRCTPDIGGLGNGSIFSPHQAVLDIEVVKEFNELLYGFEVAEEVLGTEDVVQAGFVPGFHMSSELTLKRMRDEVPFSCFLLRGLPAGSHHDKKKTQTQELLEEAADAVEAAIVRGKKIDPDVELGNELFKFVRAAASELGIEAPPLP